MTIQNYIFVLLLSSTILCYLLCANTKDRNEPGLKFEGPSISDASQFNFKVETGGTYYIVVKDHLKNVISKSEIKTNIGDNVLRFYTNAIPDGDYFIEFKDPQDNVIESNKITIQ